MLGWRAFTGQNARQSKFSGILSFLFNRYAIF
ncbi:hypothetical protein EcWSU1_02627 [Enterobacter ludwigii]|uniref:Uncharacterized protein n=1 Tax=Enterobacter ludwigii TaxID=299767 RepID=G8LF77_9ENTR|nr:hypothetical protein EcWSU1_02627 [Enterobacter ludwigii]